MKLKSFFRKRRINQVKLNSLLGQAKMGTTATQRTVEVADLDSGSIRSRQRVSPVNDLAVKHGREGMDSDAESETEKEDLSVTFGYQCRRLLSPSDEDNSNRSRTSESSQDEELASMTIKLISKKSSSFSCLSGAALSANATQANTAIGNGLIGEEILPGLDSPRTFRKLVSSSSPTKLELSRHSENTSLSTPNLNITTSPPPERSGKSFHPGSNGCRGWLDSGGGEGPSAKES